jgi:hypothetical protein
MRAGSVRRGDAGSGMQNDFRENDSVIGHRVSMTYWLLSLLPLIL